MSITFNNIPDTTRTPGVYVEIDNSRALKGLYANPHKALIIGQKIAAGSVPYRTLKAITRDSLADGYFGAGSELARMCNVFKNNNPNTELYAVAISCDITSSASAIAASTTINFSDQMSGATLDYDGTLYLMINGVPVNVALTSAMSGAAIGGAILTTLNTSKYSHLPVVCSVGSNLSIPSEGSVFFSAVNRGAQGNNINIRVNYYAWQSNPIGFSTFTDASITHMANGADASGPVLSDAWGVIDNEHFNHIIQPYTDATNLTSIEDELANRFLPMEDLQGHGYTVYRGSQVACTSMGITRNSPHNVIMGFDDAPNCPEEWAAALGAIASKNLNSDPARPLHYLELKGMLPPPAVKRFIKSERETLLYDGIATWITDGTGGKVLIERCITTYQANAVGLPDPSYLDIQTLATLAEIRYQFKARMSNRFLVPRYKLADDTFPVQAGSYVVTPSVIRQEIIALFADLRDKGLIENLDEFIDNLVVERNSTDVNRVDCLLPADLINQFRILAANIQFIL